MRATRWPLLLAVLASILVLGMATSGCLLQRVAPLSESEDGTTVQPPPGATIKVSLESNKTTGFSWMVAELGPTRQIGQAEYEEPSSQLAGAAGRETFTFKTNDSGSGELRLEYRRPWESKDIPAEKTWSVNVTVQ